MPDFCVFLSLESLPSERRYLLFQEVVFAAMVLNTLPRKVSAQQLPFGLLNMSNDLQFSFSGFEEDSEG